MSEADSKHTYSGTDVDVDWDGKLCIHVGECGRADGDLFVTGRRPWCQPDATTATDEVTEVVERCPTGALTYRRKDGGDGEAAATSNTVAVANNGPLYLRGDLHIEGVDSAQAPGVRYRAALCRCGQSRNKPFCDNSHEKAGFIDRGAIGSEGPGVEQPGGPLQILPAKNGPLVLTGNLVMLAASGREAWHGTKVALCRCGASQNKPFCDGSHTEAGFSSDQETSESSDR